MSRARTFGIFASLAASAALVAGCGAGEGTLAAQDSPTPAADPAAQSGQPAAAPTPGAVEQLGVFAPTSPEANAATFGSYSRFPKTRAGKIFVDPTVKAEPVAPAPSSTPSTDVTTVPLSPTSPTSPTPTSPTTSPTTPPTTSPVTTQLVASLDISGQVQTAKVGDPVPTASPMFTVQAITADKVTLSLNTGTLPGGGTTQDILKGQAVTLTNPTTSVSYTITVVEIKSEV